MNAVRPALVLLLVAVVVLPGCALWRRDEVVLLPKADGSTGAIAATSGKREVVLDQPYAAVKRGATGLRAGAADAETVRRRYGDTLAALPPAPSSYLIYFPTGSDEFTAESLATLARLIEESKARPEPEITVVGHTDTVGDDAQNDILSAQRAGSVRDRLVAMGLPADHIVVAGRGSREPRVPTARGVAEPLNRRVEVSVR